MAFRALLGDLLIRLVGDSTGFDKMLANAEGKLTKLSQRFVSVGTKLTAAFTVPLVGIGLAAIKAAADAEQVRGKFAVVFSDVASQAEAMANTLDKSFGFSSIASRELLANTGDLLAGFGFTQRQSLELSGAVQKLASDLAEFTDIEGGAERASRLLTKGLLGEREGLKALGIAINENSDEFKAALKQVERMTGATGTQAKALATLALITTQSKNAIGAFARESGSFSGQMRLLRADVADVAVEIGEVLLPAAKTILGVVRRSIAFWRGLSDETKRWAVGVAVLVAAIGPLLIALGLLIPIVVTGVVIFLKIAAVLAAVAAGALLLGAQIAILDELFVQISGTTRESLLDMALNFKIFGVRVRTFLQVAWLGILKGWEFIKFQIQRGILELRVAFGTFAQSLEDSLTEALASIGRSVINLIAQFTPLLQIIKLVAPEKVEAALQAVSRALVKTTFPVVGLAKGAALTRTEADAQARKLAERQRRIQEELSGKISDAFKKEPIQVPEFLKNIAAGFRDLFKKVPEGTKKEIDAQAKRTKAIREESIAENAFKQISLRRFALEGPGGLARQTEKKQSTEDKGANEKLGEIIGIMKGTPRVAVLA